MLLIILLKIQNEIFLSFFFNEEFYTEMSQI